MKKNYAIIGAAGFVAPRHMRAIKETGGNLIAVLDPADSVGILDSYFPDCKYFSEFERFDRHCVNQEVDYCVVCSPNYLHFEHCKWALHAGMDVICEKPTVLTTNELNRLKVIEYATGHSVYSILQLRLGDVATKIKASDISNNSAILTYCTPRGIWYNESWKGAPAKSGGLSTAIGVHLLDLLLVLFGMEYSIISWNNGLISCGGVIKFGEVKVSIDLSIERTNEPIRSLTSGKNVFNLSKNFTDLHIESYRRILLGQGVRLRELHQTIALCEELRGY